MHSVTLVSLKLSNRKCSCEGKIERVPFWGKVISFYPNYLVPNKQPRFRSGSVEYRLRTKGDELSPARWWVRRQLSSCVLEGLSLHLSEHLNSSVAGSHNFQVLTVVILIHLCSTSRGKEFHVDSVVWIAPIHTGVYVPGLRANALLLWWDFIWSIVYSKLCHKHNKHCMLQNRKGGDFRTDWEDSGQQ